MAYKMDPSQLKFAEKLVILNDRSVGMLTRLYNMKKGGSADSKTKPAFLQDKQMEGAIKHVVKKFPVVDTRSNQSTFAYAATIKEEIKRATSLYYYTFVDLMDLKDNVMGLLTLMDAAQCQLDITFNYELTSSYLNLVVNMVSLMILMSRIEDRKLTIGLFNAAHDLMHGSSEPSFPRLGQMILDYDQSLKKLSEELGPLNRLMHQGLVSLASVYVRRNLTADKWRQAQILSLTANPQQILYAAQTDTIACEYLSLDVMDRWIVLCTTVCHNSLLSDNTIYQLWQHSLQMGMCIRIFRDEVFLVHQELTQFYDTIKGYSKRSSEVKDHLSVALQQSATIHAERRRFLRSALKELILLIRDQPGLLGPKILFVWMALSFSRDEVLWLLRHIHEWPVTKKGNKGIDELQDKQLSELLFYICELRELVLKYSGVIHRYYLQYVARFDAIATMEIVRGLGNLNEDDKILLADFSAAISNINSDTDLRALRLDWFRFQARTSLGRSQFSLLNHKKLAIIMNTNVFHLKMIDNQEEMLKEVSDLSIYCFHPRLFEKQTELCVSHPAQSRYAVSFARICSHFTSCLHEMCPEEKPHILERSLACTNGVLDKICRTASEVIGLLCEYELKLAEQTSATQVALVIAQQLQRSKGGKNTPQQIDYIPAGEESYRADRQKLTYPDKLHTALVELCTGLGQYRQIRVSDHIFAPREYLAQHLENKFVDLILEMTMLDANTPRRPSELFMAIQAYMAVLQNIDTCITVDITRLFNNALLQQTQPLDSRCKDTITSIYTKWYLEVVLRRASIGAMVWSDHLQAMVASEANPFSPEQYTDPHELRCLAQILGPYGVKYFAERLTWHVACQIHEMHRLVQQNKEWLNIARQQFDNPEKMRELMSILSAEHKDKKTGQMLTSTADCILQRTAIVGQIFSFRDALHAALKHVLAHRLPFMTATFNNLYDSLGEEGRTMVAELAAAMGQHCPVDIALVKTVSAQSHPYSEEEFYTLSCLLLVAIAVSLPRLASIDTALYKASIRANSNNSHCIPLAVNTMAGALFHLHQKGDTMQRIKEFLALASSCILRNACDGERNRDACKNQTALYIILEQLVDRCDWLTMDILERCLPYNLVRTAYQHCYDMEKAPG